MDSRRITFANPNSGHQLAGIIDQPAQDRPLAWVLFAHCFTCGKSLKSMRHMSKGLTGKGMGVLRFDFTGLGESQGNFADSSLSSNVDDLLAAARWLTQEHQPPAILIGHSFGGAAVLQAAAQLAEVRAVVTIAAPFDPQHVRHLFKDALTDIETTGAAQVEIAGRTFTIGAQFIHDLASHRSAERIRNLGRPLLVLHAPEDPVVAIDNARLIYQAARHPKSFVSLDHTDHLLSRTADALYVGELVATWAARYLERS